MWFKHRAWIPVAWLLSLGNLVAVWFAAQPAEAWHATIHAMLAVLFGVGAQRLMARQRTPLRAGVGDDREQRLEQAIDAIAVELERVGEGQRFVTKRWQSAVWSSIAHRVRGRPRQCRLHVFHHLTRTCSGALGGERLSIDAKCR